MKCGNGVYMMNNLKPTLWRTCRMLANTRRLMILRQLVDTEPMTLTQLAERSKLSLSACSQYTRQITARGLCRQVRRGRFAYFDLHADPAVEYASELLKALIVSLRSFPQNADSMLADLTAYTHATRIRVVQVAAQSANVSVSELRWRLRVSEPALYRHLDKLMRRDVLQLVEPGCFCLSKPRTLLAAELLSIATHPHSHTS